MNGRGGVGAAVTAGAGDAVGSGAGDASAGAGDAAGAGAAEGDGDCAQTTAGIATASSAAASVRSGWAAGEIMLMTVRVRAQAVRHPASYDRRRHAFAIGNAQRVLAPAEHRARLGGRDDDDLPAKPARRSIARSSSARHARAQRLADLRHGAFERVVADAPRRGEREARSR